MILAAEAEGIFESSDSSPARDVFQTLVNTFRSNVEDFMLRAQQRSKELDALVHVYAFCEKVCVLSLLLTIFINVLFPLVNIFTDYFPFPFTHSLCLGICPGQRMQSFFGAGRAGVLPSSDFKYTPNV